ncbi:MAG TPA: hypothetical protein VM677_05545, partial [Actinokineospora sp.]|nr:hypothetical protein [Actinokineospora sp.]
MSDGSGAVAAFGDLGIGVARLHADLAMLGFAVPADEFAAARFGSGTAEAVARVQEQDGRERPSGVLVDVELARLIAALVDRSGLAAVIGTVTDPAGGGLGGLRIDLVGRRANGERSTLAEAVAAPTGRYLVVYSRGDEQARPGRAIQLVVRAEDTAAEAPVPCPAPRVAVVDLAAADWRARRGIELDEVAAVLDPALAGANPADLGDDDARALACALDLPAERVLAFVGATRLARTVGGPIDVGYGLARMGVALDPAGLLNHGTKGLVTALKEAAARRVIGESDFAERVDTLLRGLATVALTPADDEARRIGLGAVLAASALTDAQRVDLVTRFLGHSGPPETFWRALADDAEPIDPAVLAEVRHTLQYAALTLNHTGVLNALRDRGSLADLAGLGRAEWADLVRAGGDGVVPPGLPGDTAEERFDSYVDGMWLAVRTAFPGAAAAADLSARPEVDGDLVASVLARNPGFDLRTSPIDGVDLDGLDRARAISHLTALRHELTAYPDLPADLDAVAANPIRAGVTRFLRDQPTFELGRTALRDHLAANPLALAGVAEADRPAVVDQLRRLERVGRFTAEATATHRLLGAGLHSAQHIARVPAEQFLSQFGTVFTSTAHARSAHQAARTVSTAAAALFASVHQTSRGVSPAVIGAGAVDNRGFDWATLFNESSFCECTGCRSVLSPAAYLVDLLHFLTPPIAPAVGARPVTELLRRRPDLQFIKLSCENTDTALPYVDLVNEILETYIAVDGAAIDQDTLGRAIAKDVPAGATAADLATTPAYLNEAAYDTLRAAVHPFELPYNRPVDAVREFLRLLGTSRLEVLDTFGQTDTTAEVLGVAPEMAAVITGSAAVEDCYGVAAGTLPAAVTMVPTFLDATGLDYTDLIALVRTRHVNPGGVVTLDVPAGVDPCDLAKVTLRGLDVATLDRLHRFVKLAGARSVDFGTLDAELDVLGATAIDQSTLDTLAQVDRLRDDLGVDHPTMVALLGPIQTSPTVPDGRSAYTRLFLSPSVATPADPAFALDAAGTELTGAGQPLADHLAPVLAALRISADDLAALVAALRADGTLPDDTLNLANLSILYRHRLLARALDLRITDLIALRTLSGLVPFGTVANTAMFIAAAREISETAFTVPDLDDLLGGSDPNTTRTVSTFRALRDGLRPIVEQTKAGEPPTADALKRALGLVIDAGTAAKIIGILDGSTEFTATVAGVAPLAIAVPDALAERVRFDPATRVLRVAGALTTAARTTLLGLSADPDYAAAVAEVHDAPRDLVTTALGDALTLADVSTLLDGALTTPESIALLLDRVLPHARRTLSQAMAGQTAADLVGLPAPTTAALLDPVLR